MFVIIAPLKTFIHPGLRLCLTLVLYPPLMIFKLLHMEIIDSKTTQLRRRSRTHCSKGHFTFYLLCEKVWNVGSHEAICPYQEKNLSTERTMNSKHIQDHIKHIPQ